MAGASALMLLLGCGFFLTAVTAMLLLAGIAGQSNRDELGWPWHVIEHRRNVEEMAGIALQETTQKSTTSYSLFLRWKDGNLSAMRVGHALKEEKARALQAQAANDLGISLLPNEAA